MVLVLSRVLRWVIVPVVCRLTLLVTWLLAFVIGALLGPFVGVYSVYRRLFPRRELDPDWLFESQMQSKGGLMPRTETYKEPAKRGLRNQHR